MKSRLFDPRLSFALLTLVLCSYPALAVPITRYTIISLGTLGGDYTVASAINNAGIIVGFSRTARKTRRLTSYRYETHAFSWQGGRMRDLGTLGGDFSAARAVNDHGEIVGFSEMDVSRTAYRHRRAFLYVQGKMRDLGTLHGNSWSEAAGINVQDKIVGTAGTGFSDDMGVTIQQAVIWSGGKVRALDNPQSEAYAINRYGQVAGKALNDGFSPAKWYASRRQSGTLLTDGWGYALAINAPGQICGEDGGDGFGKPRLPFLSDSTGGSADLPLLPGQASGTAKALNNLGVAVGVSGAACIWNDRAVTDLNSFLPPGSDWKLQEATGINNRGQICGNGAYRGKTRAFLLTPVPEKS